MTKNSYVIDAADDLPPDPREPMTERQAVRLRDLAEKTNEAFDGNLTRRQAARRIAYLEELAA